MYAVIKTGGKQHKVAEGEILKVEKLKASEGEPVDITDVLLIEKDGEVTLGSPFIAVSYTHLTLPTTPYV